MDLLSILYVVDRLHCLLAYGKACFRRNLLVSSIAVFLSLLHLSLLSGAFPSAASLPIRRHHQRPTRRSFCQLLFPAETPNHPALYMSMGSNVVEMKGAVDGDSSRSKEELAPTQWQQRRLPVSTNILTTLDPCVVRMKELIGKYTADWVDRGGIYSLAQGVVYWRPPTECQTALLQELTSPDNTLHQYGPDEGIPELREVLRHKVAVENGLSQHDIMVTVGANQAYMNCVLALLSPAHNDVAVVFAPYYFNHVMALQMTISNEQILVGSLGVDGGAPDLVWLEEQFRLKNNNRNSDVADAVGDANSTCNSDSDSGIGTKGRIRMVTLVNPGNPTGIALTKEQVQPLVDLCRRYDCWLILDATYEYFVHHTSDDDDDDDDDDEHSQNRDNAFTACFNEPHCIHIFSLSKAYALAGYRCGYLAIPQCDEDSGQHNGNKSSGSGSWTTQQMLLKVQDTIPICPSRVAQVAALGALQAGRSWVRQRVATLDPSRTAILTALTALDGPVMGGTGAMYVMGQLPGSNGTATCDDIAVAETLIRQYGVAVIPGSYCGAPGWIRVCYANLPPTSVSKRHSG